MASINLTFFEQTVKQRKIAAFGRKMMSFSEDGLNMNVPLEILNAFSRIGEEMALTDKYWDSRDFTDDLDLVLEAEGSEPITDLETTYGEQPYV